MSTDDKVKKGLSEAKRGISFGDTGPDTQAPIVTNHSATPNADAKPAGESGQGSPNTDNSGQNESGKP